MPEKTQVCANCRWFLPNIYRQFKYRFQSSPKCAEGAKMKLGLGYDLKEIKWNPKKKGCDKFKQYTEKSQQPSAPK